MEDHELSKYLPRDGDRIALRGFLMNKFPGSSQTTSSSETKKEGLMAKLRRRLNPSKQFNVDDDDDDADADRDSTSSTRTSNNNRKIGRIELGWMHFENNGYVQVRTKKGGGTRYVHFDKTATKTDIIEEATSLFFPGGKSSKGKTEDMIIDLTDFKCDPVESDVTLKDYMRVAKMNKLRFYLTTKVKEGTLDDIPELQPKSRPKRRRSKSPLIPVKTTQIVDTDVPLSHQVSSFEDVTPQTSALESVSQVQVNVLSSPQSPTSDSIPGNPTQNALSEITNQITNDEEVPESNDTNIWVDSFGEIVIPGLQQLPERSGKDIEIKVRRGLAFEDLRIFFKQYQDINPKIDNITVSVMLPNGQFENATDNGGVQRDVFTEFWNTFYEKCTIGCEVKIPTLRHDFQKEDWTAIAHVLATGWLLQRIIPIQLSPTFLKCCLYGTDRKTDYSDDLLAEFFDFVSVSEREIFRQAIDDFNSIDEDELLEYLGYHDCKVLVNHQNLRCTLLQIAHKEMQQEPSFITQIFFETLLMYNLEINISEVQKSLQVTTKKVLAALDFEDPHHKAAKHLMRYIRELTPDLLKKFLRFCTASDLMLMDTDGSYRKIQVRLIDQKGFGRRPVAHTCGQILDLPKTYDTFPEFRSEFNAVLESDIWVMDFC